jgi:hypothetical protein
MVLPLPTLPPHLFTLNGLAQSTVKPDKLEWSKIADMKYWLFSFMTFSSDFLTVLKN